ncbi:MAG: hypothetical protein J6D03_06915 [Clostridia bacterium]|nr:hypothetical protein [Clostridia bacterium]
MLEDFKTKLEYGKAIFICDNDVSLDSFRTEIRPRLMVLKTEPNKIYGLDTYDFTREYRSELFKIAEEKGLEIINIIEMIREKIRNIVDKEIQRYIANNINNIDYITEISVKNYSNYTTKSFEFLREASEFGNDIRNDIEAVKKYHIALKQVDKGIIGLYTDRSGGTSFEYDLEKQEFSISDEEILKKVYSDEEMKLILAYEQYKKGLTPPIYNEIAKINKFLEDKKSVTFELCNGNKIKAETRLSNILNIQDTGEIFIADRYSNKIIEGEPIEYRKTLGTELKCLSYSRNVLNINSEALKSLKVEEKQEEQSVEYEEDEEEI